MAAAASTVGESPSGTSVEARGKRSPSAWLD